MSIELSADGSYTLFSEEYQESYHSLKDGAIYETLFKHIFPAFEYANFAEEIKVLDICFGLGYNTLLTLRHFLSLKIPQTLQIYSPEKDKALFEKLLNLPYPHEIEEIGGVGVREILQTLYRKEEYLLANCRIECFWGDALQYLQKFPKDFFDIIYQDAFSPSKNPLLWSEEYFALLYEILHPNGIITTYSQSALVRDNAKKAGFLVYEISQDLTRNSRILCKKELNFKNLKQK